MVSVCLPSDALLQHLPSYLGFSYLGRGVSLHGCSSKVQMLLLTFDEGYLLTAALPDLQCGIAPLGPPGPEQPPLLGRGVAPPGHCPWPWARGGSSRPRPMASGVRWLLPVAPGLRRRVAPLGSGHSKHPLPRQGAAAMLCWSSREEIPHAQVKRNPSKTAGVARGHQRADTLKPYSQKTSQSNHTTTTALSNSMKLSHAGGETQDG